MRLIRPSYEIVEQGQGLQGIYDIIERCGKISYKSEPKGGEVAKRFVEARTKEKHGAVLEFGTVYLKISRPLGSASDGFALDEWRLIYFYQENRYSKIEKPPYDDFYYITTNYRVLVENDRLDDLKYLCEPTEYHEKRYCVKFLADIGVGREFLRHRVMSMVQESTRYCNYSSDKFDEECTFIIPSWIPKEKLAEGEHVVWWDGDWVADSDAPDSIVKIVRRGNEEQDPIDWWLSGVENAEKTYTALTNRGWQAQQARTVLPLSTKTEFVLCGFKDAWIHFFRLRSDIAATGKPHPQAQELANPLREEFIERQYITREDLNKDSFAGFDVAIADTNLKD